mmetsp:Transcript_1851/g.1989  ORF Transcript_1851/g.1989 Transcript_1851/m.1989 type:complete len:493 (-) Transcript_1851:124-1602(-)
MCLSTTTSSTTVVMETNNNNEENENELAQRDECDSMAAIFLEDFTLLSQQNLNPISYSIRLRPSAVADVAGDEAETEVISTTTNNKALFNLTFVLVVTYPPRYPNDYVTPLFEIICHNNGRPNALHIVQEQALLNAVTTTAVAATTIGMPSVYDCIRTALQFLEDGGLGLIQAGISLLGDDCLAHILSFLATSKEIIEEICIALPIFDASSKSNVVWKELCRRRWSKKWGFTKRWDRAIKNFQTTITLTTQPQQQHFYWIKAYNNEEEDAKKNQNSIAREDFCEMIFDVRHWFSFRLLRNQPYNMRDVLPSGLKESLARDVIFTISGRVQSSDQPEWRHRRCSWTSISNTTTTTTTSSKTNTSNHYDGTTRRISEVRLRQQASNNKHRSLSSVVENLTVHRLLNWGWELRGSDYVLRAIDTHSNSAIVVGSSSSSSSPGSATRTTASELTLLWEDLTTNLVLEEKPDWVTARTPYQYREIPDDDDYKILLDW